MIYIRGQKYIRRVYNTITVTLCPKHCSAFKLFVVYLKYHYLTQSTLPSLSR